MSVIKGFHEHKKWFSGAKLTRKEALLALCYVCNGESRENCLSGKTCPVYGHSPFRTKNWKPETNIL